MPGSRALGMPGARPRRSSAGRRMTATFHDRFPGRPRILFLGEIHSSHAQSWIRLLDNAEFNVRAFSLPTGLPPPEFPYPTYVSFPPPVRGVAAVSSDNELNFEYVTTMGVSATRRASLGRVPGTGGVDVDGLAARWSAPPSGRRDILWPKAYEAPWSKALPVLEALRIAWPRLPACRILIYQAFQPEVHDWLRQLPPQILASCVVRSQEPRDAVLDAMLGARVMRAPALVDGTPNVMWEAMACGAIPIVSPLPTITPLLREPENVLFARN